MIKKHGITLGGLQQKILNLVLISILAVIAIFACVSIYQSRNLTKVVKNAESKQQRSMESISHETMDEVINHSLVSTTAMQAYIANDVFSEVRSNIKTLRSMAENVFGNSGMYGRVDIPDPDPSLDGTPTVSKLVAAGVDPDSSYALGLAGNLKDVLLSVYTSSDRISACFIATPDGTIIFANDRSGSYEGAESFDPTSRDWYTQAVSTGDICFTGIVLDAYTDIKSITCATPVYVDGELVAVVGADVFLDDIETYIASKSTDTSFIFIVNENGQIIFSPRKEGTLAAKLEVDSSDLRYSENKELGDFIDSAFVQTTNAQVINVDGTDYYMVGSPMTETGWTVVSAVDKNLTDQPTNNMISSYQKINDDASKDFQDGAKNSEKLTLVLTLTLIVFASISALILAGRIVKPVEKMTKRIMEIKDDDLAFKMDDAYRTKDEIEVLAESFAALSEKTLKYIEDIKTITKEKERIGAELELARNIQADMLPSIFPPFPDMKAFDIFAAMSPAKEVGGDFYDFFLVDDDHLAIVMADVSGKGVPAALFMMMSKILINNFAMMGDSPKVVLEKTNDMICKNNEEEMFVTVWLGILEISTGKITAANAGHEYPIIKQPDGSFEIYKDKHGFVIGGMEGMRYKEYTFELGKGGKLFLYTDGVPEATNADNELFSAERMLEVLNRDPEASPTKMLTDIRAAVDEFVGDAPQFDDLTMLAIELK